MLLSCECAQEEEEKKRPRRFSGSLSSFLHAPMTVATRRFGARSSYNRTVTLGGCRSLALELDFGNLPGRANGATFKLEVRGTVQGVPVINLLH